MKTIHLRLNQGPVLLPHIVGHCRTAIAPCHPTSHLFQPSSPLYGFAASGLCWRVLLLLAGSVQGAGTKLPFHCRFLASFPFSGGWHLMLLLPASHPQSRNFGEMRLPPLSLEGIGSPSTVLRNLASPSPTWVEIALLMFRQLHA